MLITGVRSGVVAVALIAASGAVVAGPLSLEDTDDVPNNNAVESPGFQLADELAIDAAGINGALEGALTPDSGASWTTDDVLLTLRLVGPAELDAPVAADVLEPNQATPCYVAASVVQASWQEAVFLLSGVHGCDGGIDAPVGSDGDLDFRLPIRMTGYGEVMLSAELKTDSGGTVIDRQTFAETEVEAIVSVSAFDVLFDATIGGCACFDSFALLGTDPPYLDLSDPFIGGFEVQVDVSVHRALDQDALVNEADVLGINTRLAGKLASFDDALTNVLILNGADAEIDVADLIDGANGYAQIPNDASDANDFLDVVLIPDGDEPIEVSDFSATVTVELTPSFVGFSVSGDLESIEREGANIVAAIFNSATRATASGGSYVMTLGNISNSATGLVQVQVLNTDCDGSSMPASCAGAFGGVGDTFTLSTGIAAGESVTFTSAQIEAAVGGDFGKGDLLFIIEADQADVTATRLLVRPDGVTEVSIGNADERLDE